MEIFAHCLFSAWLGELELRICVSPRLGETCLDHRTLGGVPQRSVQDAHLRLLHAMQTEANLYVTQDLSKFFGSIHIDHLRLVLAHLGMPSCVTQLAQFFYHDAHRLFSSHGHFGRKVATGFSRFSSRLPSFAAPGGSCDVYLDSSHGWSWHRMQDLC